MQKIRILVFAGFLLKFLTSSAQQISGFSPKQIIGGKGAVLIISGSGFNSVRNASYVSFFKDGNTYTDATFGNGLNYLGWSNTEIKLEMPVAYSNKIKVVINGKEILSADTLKVKANLVYRQPNPLVYDLLTDNNKTGGITWFVHPVYWNNTEIKQAIAEVVQEFRCKTGVNYIIAPLTQWVPLNLNQGKHIIAPDSSLGVVGYNDRLWSSCVLGAETFYYNQTQLLRFNTTQNWYYGKGQPPAGASKFRYVLFHEMGHSLGLGHVNELGESMYPSVTLLPSDNWCRRDSITESERIAIQYYISLSQKFAFRACGLLPMKPNADCKDVFGQSLNLSSVTADFESKLFPNPAQSEVYVNLRNGETGVLQIWDNYGRLCFMNQVIQGEKLVIPDSMKEGLYLYLLRINNGSHTGKLLIQR